MEIGVLVPLLALLLGSSAVFAFARPTPATNAEETVCENDAVVVPEPGTVALVGLGLIGITLGTSRRRRRIGSGRQRRHPSVVLDVRHEALPVLGARPGL